ncbi:DUF998 domain-containing protein [Amnibacterium sp.]|uniref:DUF998 domain-containing protein n=1 Tax=Amnibacterium sp. TaxID=1872496 RepID=UPI0026165B97|nr:DUF998 domain-containing protein [Amnibacterium sp.]MCU1472852.1 hypothetical protein [Amnibacterium sp.]
MSGNRGDAADCTPEARVTKSLLGYGVIAGPFYVVASVLQGLLQPGFDFTRDSWSLLSLGQAGWVHVVAFLVTGAMVVAAGLGVRRHVGRGPGRTAWAYLGLYGVLLLLAGVLLPDRPGSFSGHGLGHLAAGGLGFIAFAITAFVLARRFRREGARGWAAFSVIAGVGLLLGFVAVAAGSAAPAAILSFTAAVVLSWVWLSLVSVRLYGEAAAEGRIPAERRTGVPAARR